MKSDSSFWSSVYLFRLGIVLAFNKILSLRDRLFFLFMIKSFGALFSILSCWFDRLFSLCRIWLTKVKDIDEESFNFKDELLEGRSWTKAFKEHRWSQNYEDGVLVKPWSSSNVTVQLGLYWTLSIMFECNRWWTFLSIDNHNLYVTDFRYSKKEYYFTLPLSHMFVYSGAYWINFFRKFKVWINKKKSEIWVNPRKICYRF